MYKKYQEEREKQESLEDDKRVARDEVIVSQHWQNIERSCDQQRACPLAVTTRTGWQIVRVFVSSTFTDFHSEREVLMKKVFPAVREWCERQRLTLIECDLRWGVPTDLTTPSVICVCMDELHRCCHDNAGVPFLFTMISERYGWIPGKDDVSQDVNERYRWIPDISITHMEILFGAYRMANPSAVFSLRDDSFLSDLPAEHLHRFVDQSSSSRIKLQMLKEKLQERFPEQIFKYNCQVGPVVESSGGTRVKMTGLEEFEKKSIEYLKKAIANRYPICEERELSPELQESEVHQMVMTMKSEIVLGRDEDLHTLLHFARGYHPDEQLLEWGAPQPTGGKVEEAGCDPSLFCVVGSSGMGKSAVLARLALLLQQEGRVVLYHCVGCTGASLLQENVTARITEALHATGDELHDNVSGEKTNVSGSCDSTKVTCVVIIDGLNEMHQSSPGDPLTWLMTAIAGGSVRCVVSANSAALPTISALKTSRPYCLALTALAVETRRQIANDYFKMYSKRLDCHQLSSLVSCPSASLPLWLAVACHELRLFGDISMVTSKIESLPPSLDGLLADVIDRLVTDDDTGSMRKVLCILYCSLGGCPEINMQRLLAEEGEELPALAWGMLRRAVKPFVRTLLHGCGRVPRMNLFHDAMKTAVKRKLLTEGDSEVKVHRHLADFYDKRCDDVTYMTEDLPHHLYQGGEKARLIEFYRKDRRAMHVSMFYKRFYLDKLRCRELTAIGPTLLIGVRPFLLCPPCARRPGVTGPFRLSDSCVVCGGLTGGDVMRGAARLCCHHAPSIPPGVARCEACARVFMGRLADDMLTAGVCPACNVGRSHNRCCHLVTD